MREVALRRDACQIELRHLGANRLELSTCVPDDRLLGFGGDLERTDRLVEGPQLIP